MPASNENQETAQTHAALGAEGGTRTRTALRQRDFKSVPDETETTRENANLHGFPHVFRVVRDPYLAISCHDLPWFAVAKGTNQGQKHNTGGTASHRDTIARLVEAGAKCRHFPTQMRLAFGADVPTRNIRPDAYVIDPGYGIVTLLEVVVTHGIVPATAVVYRQLYESLSAHGISLGLIMLYPSWGGDIHRLYFDEDTEKRRHEDQLIKAVKSLEKKLHDAGICA